MDCLVIAISCLRPCLVELEESRSRPTGPGNFPSQFRKTSVADTVIFVARFGDEDFVHLSTPFTKKPHAGLHLYSMRLSTRRSTILNIFCDAPELSASSRAEASIGILLNLVGEEGN